MNDVQEYIENRQRIRELESRNRELAENFNEYGRRYLPSIDNTYYIRRVVKTQFEFSDDVRALEEQREQLTQHISEQKALERSNGIAKTCGETLHWPVYSMTTGVSRSIELGEDRVDVDEVQDEERLSSDRYCSMCGITIPSARLAVHPEAGRCVGCQEQYEAAEPQIFVRRVDPGIAGSDEDIARENASRLREFRERIR